MFKKIKAMAAGVANKIKGFVSVKETEIVAKSHTVLDGTAAEAYVDTGVKILIYALFNTTIMPTVTEKIEGLFNYAG